MSSFTPKANSQHALTLQGDKLIIQCAYAPDVVTFLKSLRGAYWHGKERRWICKATDDNVARLQSAYEVWTPAQLGEIQAMVKHLHRSRPPRVRLTMDGTDMMRVQVYRAEVVDQLVKTLSGRKRLLDQRAWIVPATASHVARIKALCEAEDIMIRDELGHQRMTNTEVYITNCTNGKIE